MKRFTPVLILLTTLLAGSPAAAQGSETKERTCGNEFAPYGLEGATLSEALDYIGQVHNEYQESILSQLVSEGVDIRDQEALRAAFDGKTASFFRQKGIDASPYYESPDFKESSTEISFDPERYSPEAAEILARLQELVHAANEENGDETLAQLQELKQAALRLPDEAEVFTVGAPISVAIHSYSYWKANADRWIEALTQSRTASKGRCRVNWVSTGASDIAGGVRGALFGTIFTGPVGGLLGGTVGASVSSAGNLAVQGLRCLFGW
jgi:hypothetical protein